MTTQPNSQKSLSSSCPPTSSKEEDKGELDKTYDEIVDSVIMDGSKTINLFKKEPKSWTGRKRKTTIKEDEQELVKVKKVLEKLNPEGYCPKCDSYMLFSDLETHICE